MRIRCRTAAGAVHVIDIDQEATLVQLKTQIHAVTNLPSALQRLKAGYPPHEIAVSSADEATVTLRQLKISNGETILVEQGPSPPSVVEDKTIIATESKSQHEVAEELKPTAQETTVQNVSPEADKIELLFIQGRLPLRPVHPIDVLSGFEDWVMVRRVIPSDNSCLFNAVAYMMEGTVSRTRDRAPSLRQLVGSLIAKDPETYNEAFLGKSNHEYCQWILRDDHWGGAIELSILSQFYKTELVAFDIQTMRMDRYGEDQNFPIRGYLLYDGIHYDAFALTSSEDSPEDVDLTLFNPADELILQKTTAFVKDANFKRQFTDVAGFTLRCLMCGDGLRGEKEAREHAKRTGHVNFVEYK